MNKEEFIELIKSLIGERTDDEAISALERMSDALDELYSGTDYKQMYEDNDKMWREKYIARFSGKEEVEPLEPAEPEDEPAEITIDELFTEEED